MVKSVNRCIPMLIAVLLIQSPHHQLHHTCTAFGKDPQPTLCSALLSLLMRSISCDYNVNGDTEEVLSKVGRRQ